MVIVKLRHTPDQVQRSRAELLSARETIDAIAMTQQAQPRRAEAGFLSAWWDHIGIVLLQRARSGTMQ